jgi:dihydrofolate reductase
LIVRSRLSIIVAVARNGVIGQGNQLPWHIPEDFAWFKRHTEGHPVVMGRKTFEAIGRILPGRINVIVTRQRDYSVPDARIFHSLKEGLSTLEQEGHDEIFIIGGRRLFRESMGRVDRIYLTRIHRDYEGDVHMPHIPETRFRRIFEETHEGKIPFTFIIFERRGVSTESSDRRGREP